jgi:hypothetical protein
LIENGLGLPLADRRGSTQVTALPERR